MKSDSEVNNRHIWDRHTEGHTSEFSIQLWNNFTYSLGGTSRGWDNVLVSSTAITPFLEIIIIIIMQDLETDVEYWLSEV